jgi:hypothetical protein
LLEILEIE